MKKKNNKKKFLIIGLLLVVIGLGYAFLNANLKINGISNIGNVKWEVYFENSALTEENTLAGAAAPVIEQGTKPTEIGYNVTFNTPGEVYEFTVDVKNGGTIDATVSSLTSSLKVGNLDEVEIAADKSNLPDYLDYDLTDEDGNEVELPFDLAKTEHKTIKLRLTFKQDITAEQLAQAVSDSTIRFNMMMKSRQKGAPSEDPEPDPTPTVEYGTFTLEGATIGEEMPQNVTVLTSTQDIFTAWNDIHSTFGYPFYIKNTVDDSNIVTESYVGFIINDDVKEQWINDCYGDDECIQAITNMVNGIYSIKGGDSGAAYESNINTIKRAYNYSVQPDICSTYDDGYGKTEFSCGNGMNVWAVSADTDGGANAWSGGWHCNVFSWGYSSCDFQ